MGNSRGNRHSQNHECLPPNSSQFWNFTRDDLLQDVKDSLQYVLNLTSCNSLTYIGHSQGALLGCTMLCYEPDYRKYFNLFIALCPAIYVSGDISKAMSILARTKQEKLVSGVLGIKQFGTQRGVHKMISKVGPTAEHNPKWSNMIASISFDLITGWSDKIDPAQFPMLLAHQVGGTSANVMSQWSQGIRSGEWQKYDYGSKKNLQKYGSKKPPVYNLQEMDDSVPIAVLYGGKDKLTTSTNVEKMMKDLPAELVLVHFEERYGHVDFLWGRDTGKRVNTIILNLVQEYNVV